MKKKFQKKFKNKEEFKVPRSFFNFHFPKVLVDVLRVLTDQK